MTPLREVWKKDRSPGKLTTRYGEARAGMAFTTVRKEGLDTEVTLRGCVATLGGGEGGGLAGNRTRTPASPG
jgi:hypothetical protein